MTVSVNALVGEIVDTLPIDLRDDWLERAAIMEHEYRDCAGRPEYFLHLLRVYRAGHFPCGWAGEWPAGQLLAW